MYFQNLLHDVRLHLNQVQGLLAEGFSYLDRDPDALLYIRLTDLEKSWSELQFEVRCLSRSHLKTSSAPVQLYFVKQGSPVSPLYNKIPFSRERKIAVELPRGRSLLAEKGRTQVAKLSIPYRALIKSRVKNHWHRSKLSDTNSNISFSDTKSAASTNFSKPGSTSDISESVRNLISKIKNRSQNKLTPSPGNLKFMNLAYPESFGNLSNLDLSTMELEDRSVCKSRQSPSRLGARLSPPMEEESPNSKRRRMNCDTPNSMSSRCGSASPMFGPHVFPDPAQSHLDTTFSPTDSPVPNNSQDFNKTVKKAELWPSIKSDYQFLMDEEIIDTCKVNYFFNI